MRIHLTARHCELDPEDRLFAERRLEKLARYSREIQEAHVIVSAEKYRHTAEITLRLRGHDVASREEATEPRIAIDLAAQRVEHQIRRLKDRRVERRRAPRPDAGGLGLETEGEPGEEPSGNGAPEA
jgi:putative sigma-54 modulation protein